MLDKLLRGTASQTNARTHTHWWNPASTLHQMISLKSSNLISKSYFHGPRHHHLITTSLLVLNPRFSGQIGCATVMTGRIAGPGVTSLLVRVPVCLGHLLGWDTAFVADLRSLAPIYPSLFLRLIILSQNPSLSLSFQLHFFSGNKSSSINVPTAFWYSAIIKTIIRRRRLQGKI